MIGITRLVQVRVVTGYDELAQALRGATQALRRRPAAAPAPRSSRETPTTAQGEGLRAGYAGLLLQGYERWCEEHHAQPEEELARLSWGI